MKNLIFITFYIFLSHQMMAQEQQVNKDFFVGGSFSFLSQNNSYPLTSLSIISGIGGLYSGSTNDSKNTSFSFSPYFGKTINPRLLVGALFDYRIGRYSAENTVVFGQPSNVNFERNSNQLGFGVFTRHIFNPQNLLKVYVQPYVEYNLLNEEELQDGTLTKEEKAGFVELGVGVGLLYDVNDKIRATIRSGGITYINGSWEVLDTETEKSFSSLRTTFGLSTIAFGMELRF